MLFSGVSAGLNENGVDRTGPFFHDVEGSIDNSIKVDL
jgi:hypothetical protein